MNLSIKKIATKWKIIIIALTFIAISPFIQFDLVISKERSFQVVDENGIPIPFCIIEHEWTQYALMFEQKETTSADENGFVYLPKRSVKTSFAELLYGAYNKYRLYGIHASYTSDDIVTIKAPGYEVKHIFTDFPVEREIKLKKKQPR